MDFLQALQVLKSNPVAEVAMANGDTTIYLEETSHLGVSEIQLVNLTLGFISVKAPPLELMLSDEWDIEESETVPIVNRTPKGPKTVNKVRSR